MTAAGIKTDKDSQAQQLNGEKIKRPNNSELIDYSRLSDMIGSGLKGLEPLRKAILTMPNSQRADAYQGLRTLLREIKNTRITAEDDRALGDFVRRLPENERPVVFGREQDGSPHRFVKDIDNCFGVRIEAMTKSEFIAFAQKVAKGDAKEVGPNAGTPTIYVLLRKINVPEDTENQIMIDGFKARLSKLQLEGGATKAEDSVPLGTMCQMLSDSTKGVQFLINTFVDMIEKGEYVGSKNWNALYRNGNQGLEEVFSELGYHLNQSAKDDTGKFSQLFSASKEKLSAAAAKMQNDGVNNDHLKSILEIINKSRNPVDL